MRKIRTLLADRLRCLAGAATEEDGMELVQVAILVAIAIVVGLIFKTEVTAFVNKTFEALNSGF